MLRLPQPTAAAPHSSARVEVGRGEASKSACCLLSLASTFHIKVGDAIWSRPDMEWPLWCVCALMSGGLWSSTKELIFQGLHLYSHLSNKRDVTLTNFEKFHPPRLLERWEYLPFRAWCVFSLTGWNSDRKFKILSFQKLSSWWIAYLLDSEHENSWILLWK